MIATKEIESTEMEFAQAADMRPEETSGGRIAANALPIVDIGASGNSSDIAAEGHGQEGSCRLEVAHGTNGACASGQCSVFGVQGAEDLPLPATQSDEEPIAAGSGRAPKLVVLSDAGVGEPPDEWRTKEANRRLGILQTFDELVQRGVSKGKAAKEVGQGIATIWRWQLRLKEKGFNGLLPETEKCGRAPIWRKLGISKEDFDKIMAKVRGLNIDLRSTTQALRVYANSDECPERLAQAILDPSRCSKHAIPPSLRSAARISDPLIKAHQGPRALALRGAWTPRRMDVLPGDVFTADDTTPIWAWWVPWETSEEYPFGVKLLQGQFIPVMDVASQCIVTYVMIARGKGSYRASDIWHLFGHTFDQVGVPRLGWQLERGSWEANVIRGLEVEYRDKEVSYSRRIGGLRQLPTNITQWHKEKLEGVPFPQTLQTWTSFLPKSKTIEAALNRMQTFEGTLWGCLGRDQMRAPFEKAKLQFQRCSRPRAKEDPRNHFLSGPELASRINELLKYLNNEPMEGDIFKGVPLVNFEQARNDYPLFKLQPELQWMYRRNWAVTQIEGAFVRVRLTDECGGGRYSLFYYNPEIFAKHPGEEVAVYYDREHFEKPAQIVLARTGEFLCEAVYDDRKGSFLSGDQSGHDMRKRWKSAVMSIYGTLVKHAPSRQVPPEIVERRAAAASVKRGSVEGEPKSGSVGVSAPTLTVDRRPAAPVRRSAGPTKEEIQQQRNDFAAQAAIAAQLRALRNEE